MIISSSPLEFDSYPGPISHARKMSSKVTEGRWFYPDVRLGSSSIVKAEKSRKMTVTVNDVNPSDRDVIVTPFSATLDSIM